MKLISWSVNGLRVCVGKEFLEYFNEVDADVFYIQESKLWAGQTDLPLEGCYQYWNYAEKKGYPGTAVLTKEEPVPVAYGIGIEEHDKERRVAMTEFPECCVVTCYTLNSKDRLARLLCRMEQEDVFLAYLKGLEEKRPMIPCGDSNVAHQKIDLKNPKANWKSAGSSDGEKGKFSDVLAAGLIDTYRYSYPGKTEVYSWWFYRFSAGAKSMGWRVDYFCVSEAPKNRLVNADIHMEVRGSDHCPMELVIS